MLLSKWSQHLNQAKGIKNGRPGGPAVKGVKQLLQDNCVTVCVMDDGFSGIAEDKSFHPTSSHGTQHQHFSISGFNQLAIENGQQCELHCPPGD